MMRCDASCEIRRSSRMMTIKYDNCLNLTSSRRSWAFDMTIFSSSNNFIRTLRFVMIWYVVFLKKMRSECVWSCRHALMKSFEILIKRVFDVINVISDSATIKLKTSSRRRFRLFSGSGRLLFSNAWKTVTCHDSSLDLFFLDRMSFTCFERRCNPAQSRLLSPSTRRREDAPRGQETWMSSTYFSLVKHFGHCFRNEPHEPILPQLNTWKSNLSRNQSKYRQRTQGIDNPWEVKSLDMINQLSYSTHDSIEPTSKLISRKTWRSSDDRWLKSGMSTSLFDFEKQYSPIMSTVSAA